MYFVSGYPNNNREVSLGADLEVYQNRHDTDYLLKLLIAHHLSFNVIANMFGYFR